MFLSYYALEKMIEIRLAERREEAARERAIAPAAAARWAGAVAPHSAGSRCRSSADSPPRAEGESVRSSVYQYCIESRKIHSRSAAPTGRGAPASRRGCLRVPSTSAATSRSP